MKPVKLEMYGFMTYKNKTFIDFTKIYDSKIFIISGDTGSGDSDIMMTDTINPLKSKFKASTKLLNKTI